MTLQTPARTQQLTLREVLNKLEIPFYEMDVIWDYKARKRSQVWWVNLCLHLLLLGAAVCLAVLSSVSWQLPYVPALILPGLLVGMVYQLRGTWRSCEAHQFQLPQFAQRNLDAVKAELPGAQFSVEEFKVGVAPVDPILYVFYKGQGFGIAVWGTRGKEVVI